MIFISHKNNPDHAAALQIAEFLSNNDIECWLAPENIESGKDYADEIPKAINTCELFILLLSKESQSSSHVRKEVSLAIKYKKEIIPLKIGDFEVDDAYEYLLSNIQAKPFSFHEKDFEALIHICRTANRVVHMEIGKNPKRSLSIIRGDFQENMSYMIDNHPDELKTTVFAIGIDCTCKLNISSNKGILKWVCIFLEEAYGITMHDLQLLIDQAIITQLGHREEHQPLQFKESILISLPLPQKEAEKKTLSLQLLFIANSRKNSSYYLSHDVDDVEGIDSREIVIEVFNRCKELGERATTLFIGAMGTNGLTFPYEVITAEILNCYGYAKRCNCYPYHLYYSVRDTDMQTAGLTVGEILSYITKIVQFFKK